ncbi:alpha/beta fold hydrolase [Robertkochia solimangrovi]|uniref:alpha/beta fold hydrolase n=1 Tax=Robertkochia solimangrovi TaxID=2213046 RepID=UPI00117D1F39|nr:alpha/beta fold hydrolase [Robertkochia solimangrovi]TRZ44425.1 alpha/beta hydrolase [Robertkochia solimangrovi]
MKQLYSKITGKGRPLLILHGFLGMSDNWKTLGSQYAEAGFEVHLIDQRNHGRSFHSENFSYEYMVEDLHNYMVSHKLDKAFLLGHSMGGKTVMKFACTYPDMVEALLVADIAPKSYAPHHQQILDGLTALDFSRINSRNDADDMLSQYINEPGIRMFLLKNLYRKDKDAYGLRINLEVLKDKQTEIGEPLEPGDHYPGPVLFLKGAKSGYIKDEDKSLILEHFPKAEIQIISKAGHWLHAENPKEFFAKSVKFLTE